MIYDGLLCQIQKHKDLKAVAFADDLALIMVVRKQKEIEGIRELVLKTKQDIKYLGVHVDNSRRFTQHLERVCGKADAPVRCTRMGQSPNDT